MANESTEVQQIWMRLQPGLDAHFATMQHEPSGVLSYPYLAPGANYSDDLWDWDSYFSALAGIQYLRLTGRDAAVFAEFVIGNIRNLLAGQDADGYVPIVRVPAGDVPYTLERESTIPRNQHKPCLASHVHLAAVALGVDRVADTGPALARYVGYYIENLRDAETGLFFWADDVMVGVDNDPTVFGRPPASSANLLLNCMMVNELRSLEWLASRIEGLPAASWFREQRRVLAAAINAECWVESEGFYYSVDIGRSSRGGGSYHLGLPRSWRSVPLRVRLFTAFLPLWCGVATRQQATRLVEHLTRDEQILAPHGVRSLARDEPMYSVEATSNPSNWLGPAWGVSNYLVAQGLSRYGFRDLSLSLTARFAKMLEHDLQSTGALHEYYDPETGEGVMNPGFLNWNLLVSNMIADACFGRSLEDELWSFSVPDDISESTPVGNSSEVSEEGPR